MGVYATAAVSAGVVSAVAVLGVFSSIVFAYLAFSRSNKDDASKTGQHEGQLFTEIGYIKSGIDDIKNKQAVQDQQHIEVVSRLVAVEASTQSAHKRIDSIVESKRESKKE